MKTDDPNVRLKPVKDYWMIYRITKKEIQILTIWDTKQNPELFNNLLKQVNS